MNREQWARHAQKQWPWLFELAETFTSQAYELLERIEIGKDDDISAIRALLYSRIVAGTEALVTLARSGFLTEADVMFRSNLEALFRLAALVEEPDMVVRYLGEDFQRRARAMGDARKLLDGMDPRPAGTLSDEQIDEALRKIDREREEFCKRYGKGNLAEVKTWEWVIAGKQFDFFHGKYLIHSNAAHHANRDIERRIVARADGKGIEKIAFGIDDGSPVEIVLDALLLIARGIAVFTRAFEQEIPESLLAARRRVDELFVEHVAGQEAGNG